MTEQRDIVGDEAQQFRELPFVEARDGQITSFWAPAEANCSDRDNQYSAECALGAAYAIRLVEHMIEFGEPGMVDVSSYVADVTEAAIKRGKWTGVEIGFFNALGEYVVDRRVKMSTAFDAIHIGQQSMGEG